MTEPLKEKQKEHLSETSREKVRHNKFVLGINPHAGEPGVGSPPARILLVLEIQTEDHSFSRGVFSTLAFHTHPVQGRGGPERPPLVSQSHRRECEGRGQSHISETGGGFQANHFSRNLDVSREKPNLPYL